MGTYFFKINFLLLPHIFDKLLRNSPNQTSKLELFSRTVDGIQPLTTYTKHRTLYVWLGSRYYVFLGTEISKYSPHFLAVNELRLAIQSNQKSRKTFEMDTKIGNLKCETHKKYCVRSFRTFYVLSLLSFWYPLLSYLHFQKIDVSY